MTSVRSIPTDAVPEGLFEPGTGSRPIPYLRRLWRLRHYISRRSAATAEVKYSETFLGRLWLYLEPFFDLMVWFVIFGLGLRAGRDIPGGDVEFFVYLAVGVTAYSVVGQTLNQALSALRDNRAIPLDFPRASSVVGSYVTTLYTYRFRIAVMLLLVMSQGVRPRWSWLMILVLLIPTAAFAGGMGFVLARLGAHRPGLDLLVRKFIQLSAWTSGTIIPIEGYILRADGGEEILWWYTVFNPFYEVVKLHQWAVFGYQPPHIGIAAVALPIWGFVALIFGFIWMVRGEATYRESGNVR